MIKLTMIDGEYTDTEVGGKKMKVFCAQKEITFHISVMAITYIMHDPVSDLTRVRVGPDWFLVKESVDTVLDLIQKHSYPEQLLRKMDGENELL